MLAPNQFPNLTYFIYGDGATTVEERSLLFPLKLIKEISIFGTTSFPEIPSHPPPIVAVGNNFSFV